MQNKIKRIILLTVLIGFSVAGLLVIRTYVLNRLKTTLQQKIQSLNKTDYNIRYDTIYVNWQENYIRIDALVIEKDAYDTTCVYPEFISAKQVQMEGLSLFSLLFHDRLSLDFVKVINPHIVIRKNSSLLPDSSIQRENEFAIMIARVDLQSAHFEYIDSASCKLITGFNTSVNAQDLAIDFGINRPLDLKARILQLDSTQIDLPGAFYTLQLKEMRFDFKRGVGRIDTIRILPHYSKIGFGRKRGQESDRVEGIIPFVHFAGLKFEYTDTFAFRARKTDIQVYLKIFHDKRLPDKKQFTLLPVHQLRKLPFALEIDTFQVTKSYIEYEEVPDGAETSGMVYFDNLKAKIYNVNNDKQLTDGEMVMNARADFMGDGKLEVHTVFPRKQDLRCSMRGSLQNFSFPKINSMLMAAANMKIESGNLKSLAFNFNYDMDHSDGEIELNYEDLKVISFKEEEKNKKGEQKKNGRKDNNSDELKKDNLKSFIVNAFVIRKNMDARVPEEKRTGKVMFERNTARSIFNYWWKSVYSGVKSAYNLDKLEEKNIKRSIKKEKRQRNRDKKK